jgi:hypothetical protein
MKRILMVMLGFAAIPVATAAECPCAFLDEPPALSADVTEGWGESAECQTDGKEAILFGTADSGAFVYAAEGRCEVGRLNYPFLREADGLGEEEQAACLADSITLADRLEEIGITVERAPGCLR